MICDLTTLLGGLVAGIAVGAVGCVVVWLSAAGRPPATSHEAHLRRERDDA